MVAADEDPDGDLDQDSGSTRARTVITSGQKKKICGR